MIYRPDEIPAEWRNLLLLIPGYDSIATAGDAFFDTDAAELAIDFFPACLVHVEGALTGKPFHIQPWQKSFVANLFGWMRTDEFGRVVRRYRETLLYVSRKNGKSPLCAGIALLVFFTDREKGQQDYIAAGEKEQAGMLFRHCKAMVEHEPDLNERCRIFGGSATAGQAKSIVRESDNSFLKIVSADASGKHGGNTHLAIIDELHVQPNRDLVDVFQTSFASANRAQPLFICITTADYDRPSVCNEKYEYACKVRDGIVDDQKFLPVIYELARTDKWDDESQWIKANPNLGVSVSLDYLRGECRRAKEVPVYENTFRRLHCNQITSTSEKCIDMAKWDACKRPIDLTSLVGRECYGGFDIGATSDFTAFVLAFPHSDQEYVEVPVMDGEELPPDGESAPATRTILRRSFTMLMYFWLPASPLKRDARMKAQIDAWRKQGFIRTTPGDEVDYAQVLHDIIEIVVPYSLSGIAFDKGFQGVQIGQSLVNHFGEERISFFSQGILSMAAPFRELLELISAGRIHHDGHPVMRWMCANTMGERRGGLVKPSKDKSTDKIDGVTAAVMSIAGAVKMASTWWTPGMMKD